MIMPKNIFLCTAPRCISTAFERCMMEVKNSKIFHEPFVKPYYFGPERVSTRYSSLEVDENWTYKHVQDMLTRHYNNELVFSKDMAYALENRFEIFLEEEFKDFQHTFLIRNPKKTVPSLYKASVNTSSTGWDYFDPQEVGFQQLKELYDFVVQHFDKKPVVVDADDILINPEGTISAYCAGIGIDFERSILSWNPRPVQDWDAYEGWHDKVLQSSGFTKQNPSTVEKFEDLTKYPEDVKLAVQKNLPIYESIRQQKLNSFELYL